MTPYVVPGTSLVLGHVDHQPFTSMLTDCPGRLARQQDRGWTRPSIVPPLSPILLGVVGLHLAALLPPTLPSALQTPGVVQMLGSGWERQERPSLVAVSDLSFHCGSIKLTPVVYGADVTSFGQSHFF